MKTKFQLWFLAFGIIGIMWAFSVVPTRAEAAITQDEVSYVDGSGTSPLQWNHTITTGDYLSVCIWENNSTQTLTGITYNSVAMDFVAKVETGSRYVYMYGLAAPDTGTHQISATLTGNPANWLAGGAVSYIGVDQSTPVDIAGGSRVASGSSISVDVTTTVEDAVLIGCASNGGGVPTAGTDTQAVTGHNTYNEPVMYENTGLGGLGAPGTYGLEVTGGSSEYYLLVAALAPPGAGGGGGQTTGVSATSTVDQAEQNIFNGFVIFFMGMFITMWIFKKR